MTIVAGIDVGGTFTDLVLFDSAAGTVRLAKTPTTPANQATGALAALDQAGVSTAGLPPDAPQSHAYVGV
jgi:N-methylhydantoinase A